jgi:hypothetical protein
MAQPMRRLLFPACVTRLGVFAFGASALGTALVALAAVAACDPSLAIVKVPGEGGPESGATDAPAAQPQADAGPTPEGGADEGGTEAGTPEHLIDGINDFTAGETFATTSPGYDAYVSWDDKKIYFGMSGADVGTTSSSKWVLIYVDGNPGNVGSATGIAYDCSGGCASQQAHLPFNAGYHLRWKADGMYTNLQKWSGTAWADVGPISTVDRKGTFMEISITRALLGAPTKLKVHMSMLIEQAGAEWTYAGVPSTSFADGKAPAAVTKYYELDLADTAKAPNAYAPLP